MTEPPPPRWKVVERGRRLEVIDTLAAAPPRPAPGRGGTGRRRDGDARPGLPRKLRFDGTLGWTTHSFYDERGPRPVVLDGGLARWIGGAAAGVAIALVVLVAVAGLPAIVAMAAILGSSGKALRGWITRRLDAIAA